MITVAGLIVGVALVRLAGPRAPWLRAAVLAQCADLVTFAAVWEHSQGELNPLGVLVRDATHTALGEASGAGISIAWLVLTALKLTLIGYLLRAEPSLGRYRRPVMAVATVAGVIGAASNVLAHPNAGGSLLVLAPLVVIAIRAPARYGDAVRVAAGLGVSLLLGIGGLAALSYIPFATYPFVCGAIGCPPILGTLLVILAIVLFVAALITLWLTARFVARLLPGRVVHAD
jgi:hypothetical protein